MSQLPVETAQGIRFIISIITTLARYPFPGTNIPIIMIPVSIWGIYFFWKWVLSHLFDTETKS